MTVLPPAIADYFAATDRHDDLATAACFTEDAVVVDEDREWNGRAGVLAWRQRPTDYTYTVEVMGLAPADRDDPLDIPVITHLEGDFPGGAADLTFRFHLDGDHIRRLEIAPTQRAEA
jgi:hypothetical protein